MKFEWTRATLAAAALAQAYAQGDEIPDTVLEEEPVYAMIEGTYIAYAGEVSARQCNSLRAQIDSVKSKVMGMTRSILDGPSVQSQIVSACFVSFKGDDSFSKLVGAMPEIEFVEQDQEVRSTQVGSWGLDRVDQNDLPLNNRYSTPYTGAGVNIYVIDTGINANHRDFGGRARYGANYAESRTDDGNGHGTHCAGTAGGTTYGVAKRANLIGVKVLSSTGSGSNSGVISGINWASANAGNTAAVLSMSLGGGASSAVDNAVNAAAARHLVVVAAGNSNTNACSTSPARASGVITVGATDRNDRRSTFSNYGTCVNIYAPGTSITSSWIGSTSATRTISGTSMACPHVAGLAAILLQKNGGSMSRAKAEITSSGVRNTITGIPSGVNLFMRVPSTASRDIPTPAEYETFPVELSEPWFLQEAATEGSTPALLAGLESTTTVDPALASAGAGGVVALVALAVGLFVGRKTKQQTIVARAEDLQL